MAHLASSPPLLFALLIGSLICAVVAAPPRQLTASALSRSRAARRPASATNWAGPGRQRRRWPAQLHPGSGPRQRPRRP